MAKDIGKRRYIVEMTTVDNNVENGTKRAKTTLFISAENILHLNDDCLAKIFSYLKFKDLSNVGVSNTRFLDSANYILGTNYAETLVKFHPFATITMYKRFLCFLDAFGESVRKLHITFYQEQRYRARNQQIIRIINEKCSKRVVELTLVNVPSDIVITKPFKCLEKLMITHSFLNKSIVNLIRNANISTLEFDFVENVFDSALVEHHIPSLNHFANYNQVITDSELENLKKFRQFVNANQQITSLGVGSKELEMMFRYKEIRQQFYKTIHRKLPSTDDKSCIDYLFPFESIYFGNLKCLSLGLGYSTDFLRCIRQQRLRIPNLPFEELKLYVGDFRIETVDFMVQCRQIQRLHLYVTEDLEIMSTASIALNLPELMELEIFLLYKDDLEITNLGDSIGIIIKNCSSTLKRVVVHFETKRLALDMDDNGEKEIAAPSQPNLFRTFSRHLSSDWKIHFKTQSIQIYKQNSRDAFFFSVTLVKQEK